eukprot:scaffold655058_cov52-Prasinocladus_malaysianus.AAC.1
MHWPPGAAASRLQRPCCQSWFSTAAAQTAGTCRGPEGATENQSISPLANIQAHRANSRQFWGHII